MATSGKAYAISLAIYTAILIAIFCLFSVWRRLRFTRKFFAPKRYVQEEGYRQPPALPTSYLGWIPAVVRLKEAETIGCAGVDAVVYIKFLRMCWESFLVISFIVLVIILPINLTSDEVSKLMTAPPTVASPYTFWIPPPPPPLPPGEDAPIPSSDDFVEPPKFFDDKTTPPAPAGLEWHQYADGVPELPPAPPGFTWTYAADNVPSDYYFTDLDKTTLSNVPGGDAKLIAHALITWLISLVFFFQLWRYCKEALRLRMFYLLNSPRGAESHSVLLTDIPAVAHGTIPDRLDGTLLKFVPKSIKSSAMKQVNAVKGGATKVATETAETVIRSEGTNAEASANASSFATSVDSASGRWEIPDRWAEAVEGLQTTGSIQGVVESEFEKVYESDFSHAYVAYDTTVLDKVVAEYEKTSMAAMDLVDDNISRKTRGLEIKPKVITVLGVKMGAWGREKYGMKPQKVDALEFYSDRLTQLKTEITAAQEQAKTQVWPTAFVTFSRRTAQVQAANALMSEDLSTWRCQAAPRPSEIVWKNVGMRTWERSARTLLMWICFVLLAAFFMIPVTAVQAILTTNASVGFIQDIPFLDSIITAILPGLALTIFLAVLPPIIKAMNRFAGMVSLSQIDLGLVTSYFIFQVITVFFGSFVAGTVANQFEQLINDPGSIITLLGTAAPQAAIFFLTYVTLQALLVVPIQILRIGPFVVFWLKSKFLASTERAKNRLWQNQNFTYGKELPDDTIVMLLGVTFSCMCPIIAPITFIYFSITYVVRKHDLVYAYIPAYQAGGMAWPRIFSQCSTGLVIFQLVMICILAIKKSVAGPLIVLPLPFITIVFMNSAASTFWRPMHALSLMAASEIDRKEGSDVSLRESMSTDEAARTQYLSPSFKIDDKAHEELLDQCQRMKAVLGGATDDQLFERKASSFNDGDAFVDYGDAQEIKVAGVV